ncbi:MAG: hypothetical protein JW797_00090 [Bradymonadales bacterium]|nr:hypothetical protein [Bradymonadales bacterium]
MSNTWAGVAIMLCSTSLMNLGMVLQKKAVDRMPPLEKEGVVKGIGLVFRAPLWLAGWLMTTVAIVTNMVALGLADMTVIQPLNGFGMVVLVLFSRWILGERLTPRTLWGIGFAMAGVVLIGLVAAEGRVFGSMGEVFAVYRRGPAIGVLGLFLFLVLVLWWVAIRLRKRWSGILFAFVAACSSVVGLTFSKGFFTLFTLVGIVATLSVWPSYLLLGLGVSFAVVALFLQQLSFQKGRAVVVTPVFSAFSVILPVITGRWVFGEEIHVPILLALVLIVLGVVLLGSRERERQPEVGGSHVGAELGRIGRGDDRPLQALDPDRHQQSTR